jgi:hypothetical protein
MDAWFIYYYCLQALYAPAMEALLGALASPLKKFDKKFIRKNETKKFF